jgi:hypothetical protein
MKVRHHGIVEISSTPSVQTSFDQFRWRTFVWALAATLAIIISFWIIVPPTYLTNDDTTIRRRLEGLVAPGAAPTGYVLMSQSLLGWAVVAVQRVVPLHMWDVIVASLLLCSIAALVATTWSISRNASDRVLSLAAVLVPIAPLLAGMQFTISSTLGGIAAMAVAGTELFSRAPRRTVLIASGGLAFASLLVRPMGATAGGFLVLALLVPVALFERGRRLIRIRRLAAAAVLLAVATVALSSVNHAIYSLSPAWNAFHEDDWILAHVFEWGGDLPSTTIESLRAQVGWSPNDWELLRRFWGVDSGIHSHANLETLQRAWTTLIDWRVGTAWLVQRGATELSLATLARFSSESAVTLIVGVLMAVAFASWRGFAAACASAAIFFAACLAIEVGFKELPERLFEPLQVALVIALLVTYRTLARPTTTVVARLCAMLMIGLFVRGTVSTAAGAVADSRQSRDIDAQVLELLQQRPSLLLLHSDSFPSEYWWRPFHTPPVQLPAIQLGLNNHNPEVQRFVQRVYHGSLLRAVCSDPSIIVVAEHGRLDPVTTFMKENYATDVTWIPVYDGSFRAWRCAPSHST